MSIPKYSIENKQVSTLLAWIRSGEIAIPEIQRPFVWKPSKVRDLLDSLLKGFPVGFMIMWQNPSVRLKDGSVSAGKRILIDGQQRMTALMAALLGHEVITKDYRKARIRIAYHPIERRFEVSNPAIRKDTLWIPDITQIFDPHFDSYTFINDYCQRHPQFTPADINKSINNLIQIQNNPMGIIVLEPSLDIETVTEIFVRVNSAGVPLSQADFAMSKIAVNQTYNGHLLRKAIDYFCHLAVEPDFYGAIERNDHDFAATDYFRKMAWLKRENDDLYDPSYNDMLRVTFTSQFRRGRLQDLVALLSGRNFETKQYEEHIVEDTFNRLRDGVLNFMNETHFQRFVMIIKSAGFINASLIGSQMSLNFAYILYLTLRDQKLPDAEIERQVRRWFVMSILTGRYSGSPESTIDLDIRQIDAQGIAAYADVTIKGQLSDAFWDTTLPQAMDTSSANSPYFNIYRAAQVKLGDKGFLSRDITVRELIEHKSDVHHIFPRDFLKKAGKNRAQYNQIANYVIAQTEINIQIGKKEPRVYFREILEQVSGRKRYYGNITTPDELDENLAMNCIPKGIEDMTIDDYPDFLKERRKLMAQKIKTYFESL
ncbi:MAG: DUF262 domain-containing protein [Phototrophicales bacterium]